MNKVKSATASTGALQTRAAPCEEPADWTRGVDTIIQQASSDDEFMLVVITICSIVVAIAIALVLYFFCYKRAVPQGQVHDIENPPPRSQSRRSTLAPQSSKAPRDSRRSSIASLRKWKGSRSTRSRT